MKKTLFILMIFMVAFAGCKKDETTEPVNEAVECERNNYGYLTITNNSSNKYQVYLDGYSIAVQNPNSVIADRHTSAGFHTVKVVQLEGYIFTPTELSIDILVSACETNYISYP